jgi:shikimate kinase
MLKAHGVLICLQVSLPRLISRLARSGDRRPLLIGSDGELLEGQSLEDRVVHLIEERSEAYADADLSVNVEASSLGKAVERVIDALRQYGS